MDEYSFKIKEKGPTWFLRGKKKTTKRFQKQNKTTKKQTIEIRKENIVLTFHSNLNNENHSSLESIMEIYFGSLGVVSKQTF